MTGEELTDALKTLGWSHGELARRLGMSRDRTVREWAQGRREIPARVGTWIAAWVKHIEGGPQPPEDWHGGC